MNPSDVALILPLGTMVGGHVTPIDHQYSVPIDFHSAPDTYEVYSAVDGFIISVGVEQEQVNPPDKITVVIETSCTFWVWYNLLTSLPSRGRSTWWIHSTISTNRAGERSITTSTGG